MTKTIKPEVGRGWEENEKVNGCTREVYTGASFSPRKVNDRLWNEDMAKKKIRKDGGGEGRGEGGEGERRSGTEWSDQSGDSSSDDEEERWGEFSTGQR
jgi:hypothetical protein